MSGSDDAIDSAFTMSCQHYIKRSIVVMIHVIVWRGPVAEQDRPFERLLKGGKAVSDHCDDIFVDVAFTEVLHAPSAVLKAIDAQYLKHGGSVSIDPNIWGVRKNQGNGAVRFEYYDGDETAEDLQRVIAHGSDKGKIPKIFAVTQASLQDYVKAREDDAGAGGKKKGKGQVTVVRSDGGAGGQRFMTFTIACLTAFNLY